MALSDRYEAQEVLGKGTFGVVLRCYDAEKKEMCAIKVINCNKTDVKQVRRLFTSSSPPFSSLPTAASVYTL